jgi:hyperosmotically inducible periplasmic protein
MFPHSLKRIGLLFFFAASLTACDKPGPAESAGKSIDQAATEVGKKTSDVANQVKKQVSDSEITGKVKAAILNEPGLDSLKIAVDTVNGTVTLNGTVGSSEQSDKAKSVAASVDGVQSVVNRLTTVAAQ